MTVLVRGRSQGRSGGGSAPVLFHSEPAGEWNLERGAGAPICGATVETWTKRTDLRTRGAGLGWVRESQEAGRGGRESRVMDKALRGAGGPWSPAHGGPTALVRLGFLRGA